jgi:5S rRNA maturation endonuclease (ribonuclease M5)
MVNIAEKIASLGEGMQSTYNRPNPERLKNYQQMLLGNATAMDYLRITRNLTLETINYFGLGYDSEKRAIAIPVYKDGVLINIKYRFIDADHSPKYINEKNAEVWMFHDVGITEAQKKGGVLITEGEFDCMSVWQAGIKNVVSVGSGKDSYGRWLTQLDNVPKVYLAYDNDKPGREASAEFAQRIGIEKTFDVRLPEDIKDANEYFKKHNSSDFRELVKQATPFTSQSYKSILDIASNLWSAKLDKIKMKYLPDVQADKDWVIVLSGKSNVGKTSYALNLIQDLLEQDIPCLVLPFERGMDVVGGRYLQVKLNFTEGEIVTMSPEDQQRTKDDLINTQLYFSMPSPNEAMETIKQARRIFGCKVVLIDHLDLMVRQQSKDGYERNLAATIQEIKKTCQEAGVLALVVHHIRKIDSPGAMRAKTPRMEDLKGSAALYQDQECVVMLTSEAEDTIKVDVVKNKGKMASKTYPFNRETGTITQTEADEVWDSIQ